MFTAPSVYFSSSLPEADTTLRSDLSRSSHTKWNGMYQNPVIKSSKSDSLKEWGMMIMHTFCYKSLIKNKIN